MEQIRKRVISPRSNGLDYTHCIGLKRFELIFVAVDHSVEVPFFDVFPINCSGIDDSCVRLAVLMSGTNAHGDEFFEYHARGSEKALGTTFEPCRIDLRPLVDPDVPLSSIRLPDFTSSRSRQCDHFGTKLFRTSLSEINCVRIIKIWHLPRSPALCASVPFAA